MTKKKYMYNLFCPVFDYFSIFTMQNMWVKKNTRNFERNDNRNGTDYKHSCLTRVTIRDRNYSSALAAIFFLRSYIFVRLFTFGPIASASAYVLSVGAIGQACTARMHAYKASAAWRRGAPFHGLTQPGTRAKRAIR